jgi:tricorn protease
MNPRCLAAAGLLAALAAAAPAQEPIRFARTPDISPDGKLVAFSYLGDVWTVEAIGGVARPVTMHEAHDVNPVFSPDGRRIAFSSNRHGSYDVFVVPAVGGKPKRLTFDSGQDMVTGWTPDGKNVLFASTRSPGYPPTQEVWSVPADGGAERRWPLFEGKEAYPSPDGKAVAFVRGPGLWYRKGYHGSSNDDIWLSNPDGTNPRPLTRFDGQDTSPMWAPDGSRMYYVSENGSKPGCANVVVQELNLSSAEPAAGPPTPLTHHADEFVRRARLSGNGEWVVYECGADLWVVSTKGGTPRKLAIEVHADDKANTERTVTFTRDATDFALSPDEQHAVVVVHGELFLTKVPGGGKATRLTDSPAFDHAPAWSPDGKRILFASDRTGVEELYLLEADDPDTKEITAAHRFKTTQLTRTGEEESGAGFSPKGDVVSFLRGGQLWTMKPDGTDQKVLVADKQVFDYDWSPDSKYLAFARMDGSFASEIYIIPADGSEKPRNVTRYATFNGDVTWSRTGGKLAFVSQRRGNFPAMHVLALQRPNADGGSPGRTVEIEWDDIHQRVDRPAPIPADGGAISPDGSKVAFAYAGELFVVASDGKTLSRVTSGGQSPRGLRWARRSPNTVYFLNRDGELRYASAGGIGGPVGGSLSALLGGGGDPGKVSFQAKLTINRDEEFAEMFAQSWRALSDNFYDDRHHGADWAAVRAKYAPLVGHVGQREDLYAMVSLMLGELNASHLGISGRLPVAGEPTADLGLLFDESYRGPGLKVAEVLKRGPADRRGLNLKPGDVVLGIDRTELTDKVNLSKLLNNKAGEVVLLDVTSNPADPKAKRRVEVTAVDRGKIGGLMYDRWVARNAEQVAKASGGRLAYIHIPGMDEEGLEAFVRALYSDAFDKDGIVLDVRYNGGGFTHDQVLNYLSGKEHTAFRQRNGGEGLVLRSHDRKWAKPAAVLINNRSYSDAEIFPHAFRASGLGKVVGQATGGHVIGTSAVPLIDGSLFRIPRIGVFTNAGVNMEKEGVKPDVPVEVSPADWAKGVDTQLAEAVRVVQGDVTAWKRAKGLLPATETVKGEAKPAAPASPPPQAAKPAKTGG